MHKGQHLLIDCHNVSRDLCLDDRRWLESMAEGARRAGATVIVNDLAAALSSSDVLDEIAAAGTRGVAVAGDISAQGVQRVCSIFVLKNPRGRVKVGEE